MTDGESVTCPWSGESSAPIPGTAPVVEGTGFPVVPALVVLVLIVVAAVLARK
jgi:hypothetical protein